MFNSTGFNPVNTYISQSATDQDTQASEKVNSRSKRSLDQIAPDNSINDNGVTADRGGRRNGGGLDSLGKGHVL